MAAIFARLHLDETPLPPHALTLGMAALSEYGQEGEGHWTAPHAGLGYCHLEVIPESCHEAQPVHHGPLVLVADAILDNRDELCDRLDISTGQRATLPDSQLLLQAYLRWGSTCVEYLHGDYAFVLWDDRTGRLFAARDPAGARPLFYTCRNQRLVMATDIRALLAQPDLTFTPDESRIAAYLQWPLNPTEACFFEDMAALPPGHSLHAGRSGITLQRWWDPRNIGEVRFARREDYAERCRELLEAAVADRIRTSHPVGSHLSGGLDSTGVTLLASRQLKQKGRRLDGCYTWAPPVSTRYPLHAEHRDERRLIAAICTQEGIPCLFGSAAGDDYVAFLGRDMAVEGHCDLFEELPMMAAAAQRGTRVMLSGWGGDEALTFTTRGVAAYLLRTGKWPTLLGMARRHAGGLRRWRRWSRFLWQEACLPLMPDALYDRFSPYMNTQRLDSVAQKRWLSRFPHSQAGRGAAWRVHADPRRVQQALLDNGHLAARMSTWSNWAAPHRLVYRYPLTDRRLLEFALGLPRELLWQEGTHRWVYRRALHDLLPAGLGKYDTVNERKRYDQLVECRQRLSEQARQGRFLAPCPWIDVARLNERLGDLPHADPGKAITEFIPVEAALRTWHLWHRHGKTSGAAPPPGSPRAYLATNTEGVIG